MSYRTASAYRWLLGVTVVLLAANLLAQQAPDHAPAPGAPAAAPAYRFAPGDGLSVKFFFNPELNEDFQVRPDGRTAMQLIGEVQFAGRTVDDVIQELEKRYASEIKSPRITILIRSFPTQKVFVTGEVNRPGVISLIGGLDPITAISEAGGPSQTGSTHSAILIRKGPDGHPMARKLSLRARTVSESLQPFDVVIVPPRTIVRLDRFVDEYIRKLVPANMNAGFEYLWNRSQNSVSVVPF